MAPQLDRTGRLTRLRAGLLAAPLLAIALATTAATQETTLARLNHESAVALPHTSITSTWKAPHSNTPAHHPSTSPSTLSRTAANALFAGSNLDRAGALSALALRRDPKDVEALFVRMEIAGMELDTATLLDSAIRLCEQGENGQGDVRIQLAAKRIRESARNTPEFRRIVPQIKALLADSQQPWADLHAALLQAAMDGVPGLDPYTLSRSSGILTDWRVVGPLGREPLSLDESISPADDLSHTEYQNRVVENFQFPDGRIALPDYLPHRGTFYAASHFGSLMAGSWHLDVESGATVEVCVDGRRTLHVASGSGLQSAEFEAAPGPHRVLLKFTRSAGAIRVAITSAQNEIHPTLPAKISVQELTYLLAAEHYAKGDVDAAQKQIAAIPEGQDSAPLQFLLAEAEEHVPRTQPATAWEALHSLAPAAVSADEALAGYALRAHNTANALRLSQRVLAMRPDDAEALRIATDAWPAASAGNASEQLLWALRITAHPSCQNLRQAAVFYRDAGKAKEAEAAEQMLDGCAPESLDYATVLSAEGRHAEAAQALQQLLAAVPLNRPARLMLISELQLAGKDEQAQQASAEWLQVAPNAWKYHRLASAAVPATEPGAEASMTPFYEPYRRDGQTVARSTEQIESSDASVMLLHDHVAMARADGSTALYVHNVRRILKPQTENAGTEVPRGAQLLNLRVLHPDGSIAETARNAASIALQPGDTLDEEYVLNYAGDGGIPDHPEAFQFVFGNFNEPVLHSRFVVLTPAERADRGVVIASGGAPAMTTAVVNGMLQRTWSGNYLENTADHASSAVAQGAPPIVRVVEQENGWTVPSSAEHQRRIETIHPGPRPEDS